MISYFSDLFALSNTEWSHVTKYIQTKVTKEQNTILVAEVTDAEVKSDFFHMYPDKSPGPDGMSLKFYKKYWHIAG